MNAQRQRCVALSLIGVRNRRLRKERMGYSRTAVPLVGTTVTGTKIVKRGIRGSPTSRDAESGSKKSPMGHSPADRPQSQKRVGAWGQAPATYGFRQDAGPWDVRKHKDTWDTKDE